MRWMKLEPIVQSEVSQKKEKDNGADEFICKAAMEKQTQRTDLWTWGDGEEREKYMARVTWKLTLPYVK